MSIFYKLISWLLLFFYWLLIGVIATRILVKRRAVTSMISWLLIIYVFPVVGIISYLSCGELYLEKRRLERTRIVWLYTTKWFNNLNKIHHIFSTQHSDVAQSVLELCRYRQGMSAIHGNQLELITNTDDVMYTLIRDIQLARSNIEMVFYIWQPGGLADEVSRSLIAASRNGVQCRLMLDSAGSIAFFRSPWVKRMRSAGIHVVEALQISLLRIFFRRMDLRQHRKIILIDNHIAYTGSMNLVDPKFFKKKIKVGKWIDLMARIEGPAVTVMGIIYACDWEIETGKLILPAPPPMQKRKAKNYCKKDNSHTIQIIASGPGFHENIIHQALLISVYSARKNLTMTTPYFVPSEDLLNAICTAAQRGVEVNIIVPRNNDSLLVRWASRAFFSELLEAGVNIYQFQDGLLHVKSVVVDNQLSLIGTVNLDMRSLWLNFEITLVIDDTALSNDLSYIQQNYIASSKLLDNKSWSQRSWWHRFIERLFYFFSPLL